MHPPPTLTHTHINTRPTSQSHTANLTDSSAALIADLNRPGDLSLSLTHTQHTSFFHPFFPSSFSSASLHFFFFLAQISLALSECHFTSAHSRSRSSTLPYYLYGDALASFVSHNIGVNVHVAYLQWFLQWSVLMHLMKIIQWSSGESQT